MTKARKQTRDKGRTASLALAPCSPSDSALLDYIQSRHLRLEWATIDGVGGWPCAWRVVRSERNAYDLYERHVEGSGDTVRNAIRDAMGIRANDPHQP